MIGHIQDNEPFNVILWPHRVRQSHQRKLVQLGIGPVGNRGRIQQQVEFRGQLFEVQLGIFLGFVRGNITFLS